MYELIQAAEKSYYIQSPTQVGLIRLNDTDVCLIDGGSDKDAGRRIKQILEKQGWRLAAIYNTHSNADHIGGNQYLQKQTGCKVYAPGADCAITRHPILGPALLYGGFPPKALRRKFLLAQESDAEYLTPDSIPEGVELIPLPGHYFDMVGFRSPDDVVYLADCLSSRETLEKYQICFLYDAAAYLSTLEKVAAMEAKLFVPAHARAVEDIAPLARLNMEKVLEIADRITEICAQPICTEAILQRLFEEYGLTMTVEQHALVGSTVRSYLAWLWDTGRVSAETEDNLLLWRRQ